MRQTRRTCEKRKSPCPYPCADPGYPIGIDELPGAARLCRGTTPPDEFRGMGWTLIASDLGFQVVEPA